jgi:phospholipase/lecithinase/hemolysin
VKLIDTCTGFFNVHYYSYLVYGQFAADYYLIADGLHPTPCGYTIMANYIVSHLD